MKYYMTSPGAEQNVPYGYTLREDLSDGSALLFENQYPLSFGYTYDTWMDREEYLKLTPLERQQVMLGGSSAGGTGRGRTDRDRRFPCQG